MSKRKAPYEIDLDRKQKIVSKQFVKQNQFQKTDPLDTIQYMQPVFSSVLSFLDSGSTNKLAETSKTNSESLPIAVSNWASVLTDVFMITVLVDSLESRPELRNKVIDLLKKQIKDLPSGIKPAGGEDWVRFSYFLHTLGKSKADALYQKIRVPFLKGFITTFPDAKTRTMMRDRILFYNQYAYFQD